MRDAILEFEQGLDPGHPDASTVPCRVVGYGEISTIFEIDALAGWALKRLPVFRDEAGARSYENNYRRYCEYLDEAGIRLPEDSTEITPPSAPGRPWCLYIAQKTIPPESFVHRRIAALPSGPDGGREAAELTTRVCETAARVWAFNAARSPNLELALDGQLSNWALVEENLVYVDTGTPLFRIDGREQLDPEPLLAAAPVYLRWILKLLFLDDVMGRYYDLRKVSIDLVANLYKEGRPDLIETVMEAVNATLASRFEGAGALSEKEIAAYYREDKAIWALFLAFRRFDRWTRRALPLRRYEFILPGPIRR